MSIKYHIINKLKYSKLEEFKNKYGLSIYKLTNIAIYNALNSDK